MEQTRQGDILLEKVNKMPPPNAIRKKEVVLAEGELTGHRHLLTSEKILEWIDCVFQKAYSDLKC